MWLGEELVNRIRKYELSRLKASHQPQVEIPKIVAPRQEVKKPAEKWEIQEHVKKWIQG